MYNIILWFDIFIKYDQMLLQHIDAFLDELKGYESRLETEALYGPDARMAEERRVRGPLEQTLANEKYYLEKYFDRTLVTATAHDEKHNGADVDAEHEGLMTIIKHLQSELVVIGAKLAENCSTDQVVDRMYQLFETSMMNIKKKCY